MILLQLWWTLSISVTCMCKVISISQLTHYYYTHTITSAHCNLICIFCNTYCISITGIILYSSCTIKNVLLEYNHGWHHCAYTHTHTRKHTHTHTHANTCKHTHTRKHMQTHTYTHTRKHTQTHIGNLRGTMIATIVTFWEDQFLLAHVIIMWFMVDNGLSCFSGCLWKSKLSTWPSFWS